MELHIIFKVISTTDHLVLTGILEEEEEEVIQVAVIQAWVPMAAETVVQMD
jgi:hypothetical protein